MVASKHAKGSIVDPKRQPDLFMPTPVGLEDRLDGGAPKIRNNVEGYGLNLDNLSGFRNKPESNYEAAQYLFYGVIDMERVNGVPHEIHEAMTTAETAAMYIGDAKLKMLGSATLKRGKNVVTIKYTELKDKPVEEIISALVTIGFQYVAVRRMKNKGFHQYSTGRGDLRKRIAALPEPIKQMFLLPFGRRMAVSNVYDKVQFDFIDPNSDGSLDHTAAVIYTRRVADYMARVCQTNSTATK
jgi:hypothetical protein